MRCTGLTTLPRASCKLQSELRLYSVCAGIVSANNTDLCQQDRIGKLGGHQGRRVHWLLAVYPYLLCTLNSSSVDNVLTFSLITHRCEMTFFATIYLTKKKWIDNDQLSSWRSFNVDSYPLPGKIQTLTTIHYMKVYQT